MAILAATTLAIWAIGITALAIALPHALRQHPIAALAYDLNPAGVTLLAAIAIAYWPATLLAAGLNRLAGGAR